MRGRSPINNFWIHEFIWAEELGQVQNIKHGGGRQAEAGIEPWVQAVGFKNYMRVSNRNLMRQSNTWDGPTLPTVTTRKLADAPYQVPSLPRGWHPAKLSVLRVASAFFSVTVPGRCQRGPGASMAQWKMTGFSEPVITLPVPSLCPWAHFFNSNLQSPH